MKTRFLLAMALPLAFAACSEDAFDGANSNEATVGAEKLASRSVLTVNNGEATSRFNKDGWEAGDKVGLAWFNNTANGVITDDQGSALQNYAAGADAKLYANHLFTYNTENSAFTNEGDIYNGAYFAYYPFQRQAATNGASIKTVILNGEQTEADASKAYFAGAFAISARDMITADDIQDGAVQKQFSLKNLSNALVVKTTMGDKYTFTDAQLADMKVTEVTVEATGAAFTQKAYLNPQMLPSAVYNATTHAYEADNTLKNMTATKLIYNSNSDFDSENAILTNESAKVKPVVNITGASMTVNTAKCDASLADTNNGFVLFTLPVAAATVNNSAVTVTLRTNAGKIVIGYADNATAGSVKETNNKAIEKLVALLSADGSNKVKLSEIQASRIGLDFAIDMRDFTPIYGEIKNAAEWNAAVKYCDTFMPNAQPTFKIADDITFTEDEVMTLPKKGLADVANAASVSGKTITFKSGKHEIAPATKMSVFLNIKKNATVTVDELKNSEGNAIAALTMGVTGAQIVNEGVLNVNGQVAGTNNATTITNGSSTAKGTINVGVNGQVKTNISVTNSNGTITCGYNSYVAHDKSGTIKGILDGSDEVAKTYYPYLLARMLAKTENATGADAYPVMCNTIEFVNMGTVKTGTSCNVSSANLPWASAGTHEFVYSTLGSVNVILDNTTLSNVKTTDAITMNSLTTKNASAINGAVTIATNATVASGTLTIDPIKVGQATTASASAVTLTEGNVTVKEGAALKVTKSTVTLTQGNMANEGAITVAGAADATSVDATIAVNNGSANTATGKITNDKKGVITVTGKMASITYKTSFTQAETATSNGNIVKN